MKDCTHKYEPRYDIKFNDKLSGAEIEFIHREGTNESIEIAKEKIYIYDICVNCGNIIDRKRKEN